MIQVTCQMLHLMPNCFENETKKEVNCNWTSSDCLYPLYILPILIFDWLFFSHRYCCFSHVDFRAYGYSKGIWTEYPLLVMNHVFVRDGWIMWFIGLVFCYYDSLLCICCSGTCDKVGCLTFWIKGRDKLMIHEGCCFIICLTNNGGSLASKCLLSSYVLDSIRAMELELGRLNLWGLGLTTESTVSSCLKAIRRAYFSSEAYTLTLKLSVIWRKSHSTFFLIIWTRCLCYAPDTFAPFKVHSIEN